ncbi:GNAT family N-acetyltransferase [Paucibacter sp. TC2R-5]|uniref:GNAT family N-acetyltransferase n=1 Tax=Paucibacter sp. TC2R-5 TaxID=2893555 RepID=UPI0021E4A3A6|nr:GNAT family N-acetyltransferase [Paucibacter sp. TC2R-5]MCV2357483.1 GNAT family N-acetyltransferase [Paucibacter sp. TC2R-5]
MFSPVVESFWQSQFLAETAVFDSERLSVHIKPELEEARRLVLLKRAEGKLMVALKPALAQQVGLLSQAQNLTPESLRLMLRAAGIALHGADHVFHFSEAALAALLAEPQAAHIRPLSAADEKLFADFLSQSSEQDLDDAWVELDHWAVFGAFDAQGQLMCAASMYPWDGAPIADIGVLTLPAFRGQGQARRVVRAICRHAAQAGYQTQYRCQLDNAASIALAQAAGLSLYGNWDVIAQDADA